MRWFAALVAAAALALGGCGNAVYVGTDEGDPAVDGFRCVQPTGPSGMLVLIAQSVPGVSVNDIIDPARIDELSGTSALFGQPVDVRPV